MKIRTFLRIAAICAIPGFGMAQDVYGPLPQATTAQVDVKTLGAVCNGVADDAVALNAIGANSALNNVGLVVSANCAVSSTVTISQAQSWRFLPGGIGRLTLLNPVNNAAAIAMNNQYVLNITAAATIETPYVDANNANYGRVTAIGASASGLRLIRPFTTNSGGNQLTGLSGNTHTNTTVDGFASTTKFRPGDPITGTDIPTVPATTVVSIDSASSITISQAATGTHASSNFAVGGLGYGIASFNRNNLFIDSPSGDNCGTIGTIAGNCLHIENTGATPTTGLIINGTARYDQSMQSAATTNTPAALIWGYQDPAIPVAPGAGAQSNCRLGDFVVYGPGAVVNSGFEAVERRWMSNCTWGGVTAYGTGMAVSDAFNRNVSDSDVVGYGITFYGRESGGNRDSNFGKTNCDGTSSNVTPYCLAIQGDGSVDNNITKYSAFGEVTCNRMTTISSLGACVYGYTFDTISIAGINGVAMAKSGYTGNFYGAYFYHVAASHPASGLTLGPVQLQGDDGSGGKKPTNIILLRNIRKLEATAGIFASNASSTGVILSADDGTALTNVQLANVLGVGNGGSGAYAISLSGGSTLGANVFQPAITDPTAVVGAVKSDGAGTYTQANCAALSNGATGCSTATGTSGATIPLLNGANTFSAPQIFSTNASALPSFAGVGMHLGVADASTAFYYADGFGAGASFMGRRAGGTNGNPSALANNDQIVSYQGIGYGATGYSAGKGIFSINAEEAWSDAAQGADFRWQTTAKTTTTTNEKMRLWASGGLGIGSTTTDPGAGGLLANGLTTGTNADTVCYKSDGTFLIQAAACTISSLRFKNVMADYRPNVAKPLLALKPIVFTMKDDKDHPNGDWNYAKPQIGLSAENVAKVEPRCAMYEQDGVTPKSYRSECLIALLVADAQQKEAAINKLQRELNNLATRRTLR